VIVGFSVIFIGIAAYVLSMIGRANHLMKQASSLEELLQETTDNFTP